MSTEIHMPQLGESVVEGTISRWLKQPGERVEKYEALLEVTTDKVDTEVPAPEAGIISAILVAEGATVRVGTLIAQLDGDSAASEPGAAVETARIQADDRSEQATTSQQNSFISPVVARIAAEHGIELRGVSGSGAGGRVTKKDVLRLAEERGAQSAELKIPEPRNPNPETRSAEPQNHKLLNREPSALALEQDTTLIPLSPMRRMIAERMAQSVRTAPHVTTVVEVDLGAVALHRAAHQAEFAQHGVNLTFTAYFAQAATLGLRAVPIVNATFTTEAIVQHQRIHLGIAVSLAEGLIVPVVRDANEKSLLGLARAINDIAARARARRLRADEAQGGTFTLTNHGVSGSLFATPIINQPQAAILGVGAIQKRPVVVTHGGVDAIAIRPMCYLSLAFDHRLIDGATADGFLVAVKNALEQYHADAL